MAVPIEKKRNIALIGHGGAGKTILAEAIMFATKITTRMGTIEDGNTISDTDPEEIRRKYSINSSVLPFDFDGHRVTLIDCPGYLDFIGSTIAALHAVDAAVIVVNGTAGVEPQTRLAWKTCERLGLPRMIFITGLDKENSSYSNCLEGCRQAFGKQVAPLIMTVGEQHDLKGVVNLLTKKAYIKDGDDIKVEDIPGDMADAVEEARGDLVESLVELDDELMMRYMEDDAISDEELLKVMKEGTQRGDFCPAIGGSGKQLVGVRNLLELVESAMPHPGLRGEIKGTTPDGEEDSRAISEDSPFAGQVFKVSSEGQLGEIYWTRVYTGVLRPGDTVLNSSVSETEKISNLLIMRGKQREDVTQAAAGDIVATVKLKYTKLDNTLCTKDHPIILPKYVYPTAVAYETIEVEDKGDLEKAMEALNYYTGMDQTLRVVRNDETREHVVYGMGQLHMDVAHSYVKNKTKVDINWIKPRIPYRETITSEAKAQGKFKKQTGGRGKYGDAHLRLEPMERGEGFEFVDEIVGGVIPKQYIPAVEKGVVETMTTGPLSGSKVIDVRVACYYGSYHSVDSDELSFKMAGKMAFNSAFEQANPILLEPIYDVTIWTPEDYMGDVMGDLNTRRGRVGGMDQEGDQKVIRAQVPLAELYQYINTLRSMTQGQGSYTMEFSHYEQVPRDIQTEVMKAHKASREES